MIRIGGPVFGTFNSAEGWARAHAACGYRAAYAPPEEMTADADGVREVLDALERQDLVLAEVGAWVNVVSPDPAEARAAREYARRRLALADALGARCCVAIAGSASTRRWDGADPRNYDPDFIEETVAVWQTIIDAVSPARTVMAFEAMPYTFLDGPEPYRSFLKAVDRPGMAGVHVDLCNMVIDARRYYGFGDLARSVFGGLGTLVRSCHLKDLSLDDVGGTIKFHEVVAGTGGLDLAASLSCAAALDDDMPVMLEHLDSEKQYARARQAVVAIAEAAGVLL